MKTINIEVTDAQYLALEMIAADVPEFVDNFVTDRARLSISDQTNNPAWPEAMAAVMSADGDASDEEAILLRGREMGLFKTAAETKASLELEVQQGVLDGGGEIDPLDLPLNQIQFFTLLEAEFDKTPDDVVGIIEHTITDKVARIAAKNKFLRSIQYHRRNELFAILAPALAIDDAQIDAAWLDALKIV